MSAPSSPLLDGNSQNNNFSDPFGRDDMVDGSTAFTLLDTLETFLGSHVDLLQRRLQRHSDRLKLKTDEVLRRRNSSSPGENVIANLEREAKAFQLKVSSRMMQLASSWQSAKVHLTYTVQALYLLPLRVYFYKKRSWHYFLFDLCYYVNILNFIYIWLLPQSPALFIACYCLSHGSLASAVITWRNSLVFHDQDKVTSLFIHIYAPFSFTVIRHYYPNAEDRFPALNQLRHLNPLRALLLSGGIYLIWQLLYWKFVFVDRRKKIESGQRTSSMSWLLNSKSSIIGKALSKIPPQGRIPSFMFGQLVYSIITELPAVFILYNSPFWSGAFLIAIFSVSVWNGGGFYIEVFGRKFERELEALRKELAEIAQVKPGLNGPSSKLDSFPDEDTMSSRSSSQDFRFPPQPVPSNMTLEGEMPKATET
ncbi:integral to membrane protein [Lentinula edodes]|uniref:Glycerophosphocholine acyltransferase 1 n=1 Tax=Lentinula edodes TaxID=5353 RepID=A0A1Q3ET92_LENED|nr:integral to membrane protein [Lentinula edodes]